LRTRNQKIGIVYALGKVAEAQAIVSLWILPENSGPFKATMPAIEIAIVVVLNRLGLVKQ